MSDDIEPLDDSTYISQFHGKPEKDKYRIRTNIIKSLKSRRTLQDTLTELGVMYIEHERWCVQYPEYGEEIRNFQEGRKRRLLDLAEDATINFLEQHRDIPDPATAALASRVMQSANYFKDSESLSMETLKKAIELACHRDPALGAELVKILTQSVNEVIVRESPQLLTIIDGNRQ